MLRSNETDTVHPRSWNRRAHRAWNRVFVAHDRRERRHAIERYAMRGIGAGLRRPGFPAGVADAQRKGRVRPGPGCDR